VAVKLVGAGHAREKFQLMSNVAGVARSYEAIVISDYEKT